MKKILIFIGSIFFLVPIFANANEYTFECKASNQEQRSGCDDAGLSKILCKGDMKLGLGSEGGILDGLGTYATFNKTYKKRIVNDKKFIIKLDEENSILLINRFIKYKIISNTTKSTVARLTTEMNHSQGVIELLPPSSNSNLFKYKFEDDRGKAHGWYKEQGKCELVSKNISVKKENLENKPIGGKAELIKFCQDQGFANTEKGLDRCGDYIRLLQTQSEKSDTNSNKDDEILKEVKKNQSFHHYQGLWRMGNSFGFW